MNELAADYTELLSNANLVVNLFELVLENSFVELHNKYLRQIFGTVMGTYVAPFNLYLANLEKNQKEQTNKGPQWYTQFTSKYSLMMN